MRRHARRRTTAFSQWLLWSFAILLVVMIIWMPEGGPESEDQTAEPLHSELVQQEEAVPDTPPSGEEAIDRFYALVAEYNRTVDDEKLAWSDQTENRGDRIERSHMVSFYTFCALRKYYRDELNANDKLWLFANLDTTQTLPSGVVFDYCGPITDIPGLEPSGDPRKDFNLFIDMSLWEIDFQSAFDIINDEVALEEVRQSVRARLDILGVTYPYALQQDSSLLLSE